MKIAYKISTLICLALLVQSTAFATSSGTTLNPVDARIAKENKILPNEFAVTLYKPTYLLPYYYTGSPYNAVYRGFTPNNEQLKHDELKYQISFKVPVWKNIFHHPSTSIYFAYTQQSYWQLYNSHSFFRETDYEPELFLANQVNWHLGGNWKMNFFNVGAVHQSNGEGNTLERSWNRAYVDAIFSTNNWMIGLRPWYVISTNNNNNNIASYLGYLKVLVAYKFYHQTFALEGYNLVEHGTRRASGQFTWSFPVTRYIKGYVQVFSGYGQSLIEYNHHTNSAGVGIALNDWV